MLKTPPVVPSAALEQLCVKADHSARYSVMVRDGKLVATILGVEPICLISINAASLKRGKLPINAPWTASAKSAS